MNTTATDRDIVKQVISRYAQFFTLAILNECGIMNREVTQAIASEIQLFQTLDQKENFLFLIGALLTRVISLKKASEIMQLEPSEFLKILDLMGIEFSYLSDEDVEIEKIW